MKKSHIILVSAIAFFAVAIPWYAALSEDFRKDSKGEIRGPESFTFLNQAANKLEIPGDKKYWNQVWDNMRGLYLNGEGNISILHMGGSHVQAGMLTDRMRYNFLSVSAGLEAEPGFVFPYKIAGTNSPRSVRCQWTGNWKGCRSALSTDNCEWGVSGINASTSDGLVSIKLWVTNHDTISRKFDVVRLFTPAENMDSWNMQVDSVSFTHKHIRKHGYTEFSLSELTDTLRMTFSKKHLEVGSFLLQGFYLGLSEKNAMPGVTYNAIGVNGAGTYSYLRGEDFQKQMNGINPDVVVFGIGVNDANVPEGDFNSALYEARYDSLVSIIRSVNPDCAFLFITNNDTYYQKRYPNKNAIKVQETMRRLAIKHGGAVYDLFDVMGGLGSITKWKNASLASSDLIHLTKEGYELQADMMFTAIRNALGDFMDSQGLQ